MSAFCAVCCADIVGEPLRRPLGKGDAMVNACASCDEDKPIARSNQRDYEPRPGLTFAEFNAGINRMAARVKARTVKPVGSVTQAVDATVTPGWILIRVPIRKAGGEPRDRDEARVDFAGEPWAQRVRHLSSTGNGWHLYERPGVVEQEQPTDVLRDVERFRVQQAKAGT